LAKEQKKQKGGRTESRVIDFTPAELKEFDKLRGMLSRSDFLNVLVAWWKVSTSPEFVSDKDSCSFYDMLTGNDHIARRKEKGGFEIITAKENG